ncbi:hypothetical protein N7493_000465 [Penicillium malachiteum]|uniref:Uncharacterized protein n=1 Tax=Penicillium malachiteum TaxID=1324776 RepID=A0AAD6N0R2_9EURO|nr:hypothetical protein N7493_000465 [Penicillium malachiteum]
MVALSAVQSSNVTLNEHHDSPGLVAVLVGATNGIGKAALLRLAQHIQQPRLYFIGRSQSAANEILAQLNQVNPNCRYEFIKADVSLLRNVDEVCESIQRKEAKIDILFQSQGTLDISSETSENLPLVMALSYYSRMRFIANLLPLLQRSHLSRVVIVLAGTKEGLINPNDIPGKKVLPWRARGHLCSMITLTLERFATLAPEVSFVHNYPGFVDTSLASSMKGATGALMRTVFWFTGLFSTKTYVSLDETGQRHCFLATSPMFSSNTQYEAILDKGNALSSRNDTAIGSNGAMGSGVYIVGELCESGVRDSQKILTELRQNGTHEKIWDHLQKGFLRVTGKMAK